jgi:hypothetical protein
MRPRANLEQVKNEGLVSGWCWDESQPDRAVRLVVLVDGQPVGITVADVYRTDLEQVGMGNGCHAFSYLLPWDRIASKSVTTIGLIDEASGEALDTTIVFRRSVVLTIEDRLRDVEQQLRLLRARLDETAQRAERDAALMGGIFATIGAFFTRLSELPPEAVPMELGHSIAGLLESTRAQCAPFSFAKAEAPSLTLCVDCAGNLQTIYASLRAIHDTGLDHDAEVVLIDDGRSDQAALLPSLIGNLRYWRLQPGQSLAEARNRAVLPAGRPFAAFLSAAVRVTPGWLPALQESFARLADCAILGSGLDGAAPPPPAPPLAAIMATETLTTLTPIAATTDAAMMIRGEVFAKLGGFDAGFAHPTAAAVDLCIRAWDAGYHVLHQPAPALSWRDEGGRAAAALRMDADSADLLAYRWHAVPRRLSSETLGRALVVDGSGPDEEDTQPAVLALTAFGYAVSRYNPADPTAETGHDLLYLTLRAADHLGLDQLRTIATKIVLALDPAAEERLCQSARRRPSIKGMLAAIAAVDCVLIRTDAGAARLEALGFGGKLWRIGGELVPEDIATLLRQLDLPFHDRGA